MQCLKLIDPLTPYSRLWFRAQNTKPTSWSSYSRVRQRRLEKPSIHPTDLASMLDSYDRCERVVFAETGSRTTYATDNNNKK